MEDGKAIIYTCSLTNVSPFEEGHVFDSLIMSINNGSLTIKNNYATSFTAIANYQSMRY